MSNGLRQKRTRRVETFEPSGPVACMIDNELRGKSRGAKAQLMERALATLLGAKYPKLLERWQVLQDEQNRKVLAA